MNTLQDMFILVIFTPKKCLQQSRKQDCYIYVYTYNLRIDMFPDWTSFVRFMI